MKMNNILLLVLMLIIASCTDVNNSKNLAVSLHDKPLIEVQPQPRPLPNPDKNAYFGDLHVHTENSFDAYTFGTISTPYGVAVTPKIYASKEYFVWTCKSP